MIICLSSFANAQGVLIDTYAEDSSRIVVSNSKFLYQFISNNTTFSVGCIQNVNGEKIWALQLCICESKMTISPGRKLLFKFDNGDIMELTNYKDIGPADYEYKVTSSKTEYYVSPSYQITEDQILKITQGNIVKVRIEHNAGFFDREMRGFTKKKPSRFPEYLGELYADVKVALSKERSIIDNF